MSKLYFRLNGEKIESSSSLITGREVLGKGGFKPARDHELMIKVNEKGFEPVQLDETVDLRQPGIEGFQAKLYPQTFIMVDEQHLQVNDRILTPNRILELAGKDPNQSFLVQKVDDVEIGYRNDPNYKISIKNNQTFLSYNDVNETTIYVNGTPELWKKETISYEELVQLAFENPPYGQYTEYQVIYSGPKGLGSDKTLVSGQVIKVKNKTEFDVSATDKS